MLPEPATPHRRGRGTSAGRMLEVFGDRRAKDITTREVAEYLRALERDGASPRKVNRHRQVVNARWLLDHDGEIALTIPQPEQVHLGAAELQDLLPAA